MKLVRSWISIVAVALVTAGGFAAWRSVGARAPAPKVAYTLLDGSTGSTKAQPGRVLLVNFWATTCAICVAEMPQIVATHLKFRERGFDTLAVAMSYDPPAYVARFAQSRALPFGVAIDNTGAVAKAFGDVRMTPTTFLIDKQGRVVKRYLGAPDFAALDKLIAELLAEV